MSNRMHARAWALGLAFLSSSIAAPALAQDAAPAGEARVSYLENRITVVRAVDGESAQAVRNMPILAGDRLASDERGRAEVQLVDGSLIRIDFNTEVGFQELAAPTESAGPLTSLNLSGGGLFVQLTDRYRAADFQIDTPLTAVRLGGAGLYRIDSSGSKRLRLQVYAGSAEVLWGGQPERLGEGDQIELGADFERPRRSQFDPREADEFAAWNYQRQEYYADSRSREYLPDEIDQYAADLDENGSWHYSFDYHNYVWVPYVDSGWRPYYYGEWSYYPSGLTWISYEPWGWAPYHYGRWNWSVGFGWCWLPGYVYSPAWVSWYLGHDYWGWCPIGYYGYPATVNNFFFNHNYYDRVNPTHLDPRSWTVVPVGSVVKTPVAKHAIRAGEVRSLRGDGVIVDRLPKTDLRELRSDPKRVVGRALETKSASGRSPQALSGKSRGISEDSRLSLRVERERMGKSGAGRSSGTSAGRSYDRQFETLSGRSVGGPPSKGSAGTVRFGPDRSSATPRSYGGDTKSSGGRERVGPSAPTSPSPRAVQPKPAPPTSSRAYTEPQRSYSGSNPPATKIQPAPYGRPSGSSGRSSVDPRSSSEVKRYEPRSLGSSSSERSYFYGDSHSRSGSAPSKTPSTRAPSAPRSYGSSGSGYQRQPAPRQYSAPPSSSRMPRSYSPPSSPRSYSTPSAPRSYSAPSAPRSYSPPSSPRSYSPPSSPRSYSPPSSPRSYSPPSSPRSYSPPSSRYSPPKSTYSMPRSYSPPRSSSPSSRSRPSSPPPKSSSSSRSSSSSSKHRP